jgi:hypothetical protein
VSNRDIEAVGSDTDVRDPLLVSTTVSAADGTTVCVTSGVSAAAAVRSEPEPAGAAVGAASAAAVTSLTAVAGAVASASVAVDVGAAVSEAAAVASDLAAVSDFVEPVVASPAGALSDVVTDAGSVLEVVLEAVEASEVGLAVDEPSDVASEVDSADWPAELALESDVCAQAAVGAVAIPNPTPKATANPPTRPMYLA